MGALIPAWVFGRYFFGAHESLHESGLEFGNSGLATLIAFDLLSAFVLMAHCAALAAFHRRET
jgi:hypothetical protein